MHIPVLPGEIIDWLAPKRGGFYIDGTLGGGGHSELLARAVGAEGTVLAFDRDIAAIDAAELKFKILKSTEPDIATVRLAHANYRDFPEALKMLGVEKVDGMLLDIGLSSDQLADRKRGFSFESDGPLDLRFDVSEGEPAHVLLGYLGEERIADLIFKYGEEKFSRRIAREIVRRRTMENPLRTASELAEIVRRCVPVSYSKGKKRSITIDPATRTFQALRIAVNDELGSLSDFLVRASKYLNPGGRVAVISFHSLEDRIVKNGFRDDSNLETLTKKPVLASDEEYETNSRSRSAKLRVAKRIEV